MHSRIYQLSTTPILKKDYINSTDLVETTNMFDGIADYFDDDTNRAGDIAWLISNLKLKGLNIMHTVEEVSLECELGAYVKVDKITFSFESLADYIENKMNKVQAALDEVFDLDLHKEEDSKEFYYKLFRVKDTIDDKFGFYVWDDDNGYYYTLDNFLYDLVEPYRKKSVYTFYMGATIDYHS